MDAQTHLPLRRTFQWRDPVYKDKNLDAEEYDDYHTFDGIPTPVYHHTLQERRNHPAVFHCPRQL